MPDYSKKANYKDVLTRDQYIDENNLRFLRDYQLEALKTIQKDIQAHIIKTT